MRQYYETLNSFIGDFKKEFGENNFTSINNTIASSNKVNKLLKMSKQMHLAPNSGDIIHCVMSMITFMLANKMKVAIASVLVLERWNQECNGNEEILFDFELLSLFNKVLRECGKML